MASTEFALDFRTAVRRHVSSATKMVVEVLTALIEEGGSSRKFREEQGLTDETLTHPGFPGWEMDVVLDGPGRLACPAELRLSGVLMAQSWDFVSWALGRYIEMGETLSLITGYDELMGCHKPMSLSRYAAAQAVAFREENENGYCTRCGELGDTGHYCPDQM